MREMPKLRSFKTAICGFELPTVPLLPGMPQPPENEVGLPASRPMVILKGLHPFF